MNKRNSMFVFVISTLLVIAFGCFMMIDWVEVEEYDEYYSPTDCCSSPAPPYMYERLFMNITLTVSFIISIVWIVDNLRGNANEK